jgi:hypothetical protein
VQVTESVLYVPAKAASAKNLCNEDHLALFAIDP